MYILLRTIPTYTSNESTNPCQNEKKITAFTQRNFGIGLIKRQLLFIYIIDNFNKTIIIVN